MPRHVNSGSFSAKDWTGFRSGKLTAIKDIGEKSKNGAHIWLCKCDCGNEIKIATYRMGKTTSCGCDRGGGKVERIDDLDGEEWREIKGYDKYLVSNKGRVKSLHYYVNGSERIMKQVEELGYLRVALVGENGRKSKRVHRLVAEAFIENPYGKPEVNHKDGNKKNNCVENLEWVTELENTRHAYDNGLKENVREWAKKMGKEYGGKNVDGQKVPVLVTEVKTGNSFVCESQKEAAEKTGVLPGNIWKILHGKGFSQKGYTFRLIERR